jgi:peptidoglycan/xylan/chitin deacetylase (PgdA/CDA1 family)
MSLVKSISRKVVFPLIAGLGMEKILSAFSSKHRLILCYHGCTQAPDISINGRHMAAKEMEGHFIYLKRNFNVVSLDEMFLSFREGKEFSRKSVAITYDDGYLNNYTTVFPLIQKYTIPATFFILSKPLIDPTFINWPDILDIIKKYSDCNSVQAGNNVFKRRNGANFFSEALNISLADYLKQRGAEREEILAEIMKQCFFEKLIDKANTEYYKFATAEQVKEMSKNKLVEIGSHSHSHYNLGNIAPDLAGEELVKSKKILEDIIDKEVNTIAFPDGSYTDGVKNISEKAGYKKQLAVSPQRTGDPDDKRILPRLAVSNTTTFESNMIQVNLAFKKRGF